MVIVFFLYKSYSTYFDNIKLSSAESFVLMLGLGIMVLMFGSPDYPTWYICWYAPFVMIAPTYQTRMALMLLLVWNWENHDHLRAALNHLIYAVDQFHFLRKILP